MRTTEWINLILFSFFIIAAWLRPMSGRARMGISVIGATGISAIVGVQFAGSLLPSLAVSVIRDWLPAPLMPMVYWQAGRLSGKPNETFQKLLYGLDRKWLGTLLRRLAIRPGYRVVSECLELAYLSCYVLVPLGLGVLYLTHKPQLADEYWLVILPATHPCYVFTALVPTLPPRVLDMDSPPPHPGAIRLFNLWIVRHASIQLNTFPSAHVTATLGGSLVLLRYAPSIGIIFLLASIGIALGAVTGRYHYGADVLTGALLAGAVFALVEMLFA
jgi:membrane-associated phospholipid phosphatase